MVRKINYFIYLYYFIIFLFYMRKGFLIYEEMRKYFPTYEEWVGR